MRAEIIKVGNSRGLRIPKAILEQCGFETSVNLEISDHRLIVTPYKDVRPGWGEAFKLMAQKGDDDLLDEDIRVTSWDAEEWQW
jgi:antitoxin MazE